MKSDRLFQILYILLKKGRATAPELARTLEVSVRTVYRDVETLCTAGVPVYTAVGKGGGISLVPGYTFEKALLSDEEQNQLLFALQSLQATNREVGALLAKLGTVFQKQHASWIEVDFSRWGFGKEDNVRFEQLKAAILGKQVLHIRYCGSSGATTARYIQPLKLVFKDKSWYLQAFCRLAEDFRLFKISRILGLCVTAIPFTDVATPPPCVNPPAENASLTRYVLKFAAPVAFRVYDEFEQSCIVRQPDGTILVTVCLPTDGWVVAYLFSFGTGVEVLEPQAMRRLLVEQAQNIFLHHNT